jgi:hypothetical protein
LSKLFLFGLLVFWTAPLWGADLVVLTDENWDRFFPPGKQSDCVIGDYVMKSQTRWACVAQPAPWRAANMIVKRVGGALIDFTSTAHPQDLLAAFYPGGRAYVFDRAEILEPSGNRVRLRVVSQSRPRQLRHTVIYELEEGQPRMRIRSQFKNEGEGPRVIEIGDVFRADGFSSYGPDGEHEIFWGADTFSRQAYLVSALGSPIRSHTNYTEGSYLERGSQLSYGGGENKFPSALAAGETWEFVRDIFASENLLSVKGDYAQSRGVPGAMVTFALGVASRVLDYGEVEVRRAGRVYATARTDDAGNVQAFLPLGNYRAEARAIGRKSRFRSFSVSPAGQTIQILLEPPTRLGGQISGEDGRPIAAKLQFRGVNGTPDPDWGPETATFGVKNLIYTADGSFEAPLAPGNYTVNVMHGPEYDLERRALVIKRHTTNRLDVSLRRSVDTAGWMSADFHGHSRPGGDNSADQRGRVLNLLAENIEFAPCTEHNRIDSYAPHLKALGAEKDLGTAAGVEVSGNPQGLFHQNAFPIVATPHRQDRGAPDSDNNGNDWHDGDPIANYDPANQLRRLTEWDGNSEKLVQQNHPDIGWLFFEGGGFKDAFPFIHVMEVRPIDHFLDWETLPPEPGAERPPRFVKWLQLLNQGFSIVGVANSDAHSNFHGSGGIRNWVRSEAAIPGSLDARTIIRDVKAGHVVMSTGPYLEVKLESAIAGDTIKLPGGRGYLKVRVQCPNWLDVNRIEVLINGRPDPRYHFSRKATPQAFHDGVVKFDQTISLTLPGDALVIVVAVDDRKPIGDLLGPQWGDEYAAAVSNPIYVDTDANGFQPNHDSLGIALPVRWTK